MIYLIVGWPTAQSSESQPTCSIYVNFDLAVKDYASFSNSYRRIVFYSIDFPSSMFQPIMTYIGHRDGLLSS